MSDWDLNYAALRQHQEDLLREAEHQRLVRTLRQSRKASLKDKKRWRLLGLTHEKEQCDRGSGKAETAEGR